MPTLKERMDRLEQLVQEMRDPIVLAASKDDHSLAQRILELEKQHSDLNAATAEVSSQLAETRNELAGTGHEIARQDHELNDHENRLTGLENARANPIIKPMEA